MSFEVQRKRAGLLIFVAHSNYWMAYFAARKIYAVCSDIMSSFEREQFFVLCPLNNWHE
jgi:hypothetical protein